MNKFPLQPGDDDGPVFRQPWEAQAFSLVIALHESGAFAWSEWSATLGDVISAAQSHGQADLGETYYQHWLEALERISISKGLANNAELLTRIEQWRNAYLTTAHGQAIELRDD